MDDIETLISFLGKLKRKAEQDFDDRVDISEGYDIERLKYYGKYKNNNHV